MLICCLHITSQLTHTLSLSHRLCPTLPLGCVPADSSHTPSMHFIADCKQNCNSINKLNKNKYEYAASDFCLCSLTPSFPGLASSAWLLPNRTHTQPHCLPNQPGNDLIWMHALLCISIVVRFYGKILIKRCFRVHFLPNSTTFCAVPVCFRLLLRAIPFGAHVR